MITIHIIPGPPAVGKSTAFDNLGVPVISPDAHVYNDAGVYEWTPERAGAAWEAAYAEVAALADGAEVGFDATLVDAPTRQGFINKVRGYHGDNVRIIATNLDDPGIDELIRRNAMRSEDRRVPDHVITYMRDRWTRPTESEGLLIIR
jgi:predicted kinase